MHVQLKAQRVKGKTTGTTEQNSKIERFEDLAGWQRGRELTNAVYNLTKQDNFKQDFGLFDQIRRASVSVMSNIAEGFERGSNKDFVKFLFIAKASAGEVRSLLYVALDQAYINEEQFQKSFLVCVEISRIVWGLIKTLRVKNEWVIGKK